MKPYFHRVPLEVQNSFTVRHEKNTAFGTLWHYHAELELHYLVKGRGVRFIGDNISSFSDGELILLGENLPHTWRADPHISGNEGVEVIIIQFLTDCLGNGFAQLPETYLLPKLYEKARKGMVIHGEAKAAVVKYMHQMVMAKGLDRILLLLSILKVLSETEEWSGVSASHVFHKSNDSETLRLNNVYEFTVANFKRNISLEEAASVANLSVTSFCRYFKMMTRKTYNDFLVELRISHSCRLLVENKITTEVICYECGFNNVSNFYRHFKKVTGITPLEYKRRFLNFSEVSY